VITAFAKAPAKTGTGIGGHAHSARQAGEDTAPTLTRIGGQFGSTACDKSLDHGQARPRCEARTSLAGRPVKGAAVMADAAAGGQRLLKIIPPTEVSLAGVRNRIPD
jgi:hypothetical protein